MNFRAFVAVDVQCGPELRTAIEQLKGYGRSLKPVHPDNVHITLKFLGDTEESAVPELEKVMRSAVDGIAPFQVRLVGTGVFPNARSPRVVWVGMDGAEPLGKMTSVLENDCELLGFRKEKRGFSPHLTLARVREGFQADLSEFLNETQEKQFGSFQVNGIRLKKSVLTPSGPIYSDVLEIPF
jgi:2'-5' RNA ligase